LGNRFSFHFFHFSLENVDYLDLRNGDIHRTENRRPPE